MFSPNTILTATDEVATLGTGASDTNTISVAATHYVLLYGIAVGQRTSTTAASEVEFRVDVGTTEVLKGVAVGSNSGFIDSQTELYFPGETAYQGAPGEDIVVDLENLSSSGVARNLCVTVFYKLLPAVKPVAL